MKIAIYSKNLITGGGSEKHITAMLDVFYKIPSVQIDFFSSYPVDLNHLSSKLNFDFTRCEVHVVPDEEVSQKSIGYDLFVNCTIYSTVLGQAKSNAIIIYFPIIFRWYRFRMNPLVLATMKIFASFIPKLSDHVSFQTYLDHYDHIWSNSKFTQEWTKRIWRKESEVFYPWIDVSEFDSSQNKKKSIISVGRIFRDQYTKNYEYLIEAFRQFYIQYPNYEYHIVGSVKDDQESKSYHAELLEQAKDLPIHFHIDIPFAELKALYAEANFFWHGNGYSHNVSLYPNRMEHFGIVIVEAMASGCIPFVFNGGGVSEIITSTSNGFLWKTPDELLKLMTQTLEIDMDSLLLLRENIKKRSKTFTNNTFNGEMLTY